MKLSEYLNKNKETASGFANKTEIPQPTIWRILNNKVTPSLRVAFKIEQATGGDVTIKELLYPEQSLNKSAN